MGEIKPLELLNVLHKIEKHGALEKMRKARQRCSEVFRYAIATWRAEFNLAADLSSALEVHQSNHFPFLKVGELPDFLRALDSYASSRLVQVATKLLMEGANKQVISSQADSLIKISRIWADFFPANNRISLFRLFFPPFLALFPVFTEISPTDVSFGPPETGWPG